MPTPSLWINVSPDLEQQVNNLQPTPGYCFFIDISGSTEMKQRGIRDWIRLIHNCFQNVGGTGSYLDPFRPLKAIGDALMFYIEDNDLRESGYVPLQLFDGLWQIATDANVNFPTVKIGAARCENVYSITFLCGNQDYYGIDIDMTSRLQKLARDREVVIERRFYDQIAAGAQADEFESFQALTGPIREDLRGIPGSVEVFRTGVQ